MRGPSRPSQGSSSAGTLVHPSHFLGPGLSRNQNWLLSPDLRRILPPRPRLRGAVEPGRESKVVDSRTRGNSSGSGPRKGASAQVLAANPSAPACTPHGGGGSEGRHCVSSLDKASSVAHRNQRNFRGSHRWGRRRKRETGRRPRSFLTQGSAPSPPPARFSSSSNLHDKA